MIGIVVALVTVVVLAFWANGSAQERNAEIAGPVGSPPVAETERDTALEKGNEEKIKRGKRGEEDNDDEHQEKAKNKGKGKKKGKHQHRGKGHLHQRGLDRADEVAGEHGQHGRDKARSHRKQERE
jgi:hypothetical protein